MAPTQLPLDFTQEYLSRLEMLRMKARRSFLGSRQGSHLSLKRGHGMEFSDYREYQLGDNPRYIDWGVYARSDRLYVKQFQEEQDLPIFLMLDGTASMHYPEEDKKWYRAMQIAGSLGYVGLMQHDSVHLAIPGALNGPVYSGARSFYRLVSDLENVTPTSNDDFLNGISRAVGEFSFPGLLFFLSDFLYPLADIRTVLDTFRAKNLDICCIQILGSADVDPAAGDDSAVLVDSETGESFDLSFDKNIRKEYGEYLLQHNIALKEMCQELGMTYLFDYTEEELSHFMFENLAQTGLVR